MVTTDYKMKVLAGEQALKLLTRLTQIYWEIPVPIHLAPGQIWVHMSILDDNDVC